MQVPGKVMSKNVMKHYISIVLFLLVNLVMSSFCYGTYAGHANLSPWNDKRLFLNYVSASSKNYWRVRTVLQPVEYTIQSDQDGISFEEAKEQIPPPPLGLNSAVAEKGVQLSWRAIGGDMISYNIYRKQQDTEFKQIGSIKAEEEVELTKTGMYTFNDTEVVLGITYTYTVTGINIFDNESEMSESATITIHQR